MCNMSNLEVDEQEQQITLGSTSVNQEQKSAATVGTVGHLVFFICF